MMSLNKTVLEKMSMIKDYWNASYSLIISSVLAVCVLILQFKFDFKLWLIEDYSDMLTAVITFLSIVISVFGILIPAVLSTKDENDSLANYFFEVADNKSFAKNIRRIFSSGIATILLVCILYLKNVAGKTFYKCLLSFAVFFLVYFCCNAYRFIGILIDLLIRRRKKDSKTTTSAKKVYKNKMTEEKREDIIDKINRRNM